MASRTRELVIRDLVKRLFMSSALVLPEQRQAIVLAVRKILRRENGSALFDWNVYKREVCLLTLVLSAFLLISGCGC